MSGTFQQSGIEAVVRNLDGFLSDVGKMDRSIQGIGSNTSGLTEWNKSITSVTANVTKVVGAAAVAGTAAITAFVVDSTKRSANLESALSGIAAVLNQSADAVKPLKDLILDLGIDPELKVSATEAAKAVELLARNGLSMTEIMDGAARSTVLLANATGADFGTAADIATDAMAIFNISAADMGDAVNGITGVTTSSKFSINDYRLALAQAGGVAGAVGVSFDDFNATIAGIAPNFASGSDAGTSFKTFLQRLIPASDPATDAMRDLGLFTGLTKDEFEKAQAKVIEYKDQLAKLDPTAKNYAVRSEELRSKINALESSLVQGKNAFFDNNGAMRDMDEIAQILQDALSGLSEEKKNDALTTIFGTDAMRAAVGVAELGAQGYKELGAQIAEIDAGNQAATRMKGLSASLEILNGIIETLRIRIGDKFNPIFEDLVKQVSAFLERNADRIVNFFGKLADMVKVAIDRFIPLVESWLPKLEEWVDNGSSSIGDMITKVGEVTRYIGDLTTKIIAAATPVAKWIGDNYELEDILNGILSVIAVSLIPAITSLITTITPVIALFTTVAEISSRMTDGQKQFAIAVGVAAFALPPLISAITTITGAISAVIGVGSSLVGLITGGGGIVAGLGALLNPVGLVVAAVAGLGLAWATDFGGIRTKTIEVTNAAGQAISTWSSNTVNKFRETQTQIGTTLAGWSTSLGTTLANLSSQTGGTLSTWSNNVGQTFTNLRNNAQNTFSGMSSSLQSSATNLAAQTLIAVRRIENEGVPVFNRFRDGALNKVGDLARDVPSRLQNLVDAGLRVFNVGRWIQAGADVIGGIMEGLARAATAPLRWIENFAGSLIRTFTSILKIASPSKVFEDAGINIMEGLQGGLTDRSDAVLEFMGTFSRAVAATAEEAQRLADANFKKLTDSALSTYNGAAVILGDISQLSQEIDQAAIDAQNAAHQAYVFQQAGGDPTYGGVVTEGMTPEQIQAAVAQQAAQQQQYYNAFGAGRVADFINQITGLVETQFRQVGSTGIQSLALDVNQFSSANQLAGVIAQLNLLSGTIQQNAQNAPNAVDRDRLGSLYADLTRRIIPLLGTRLTTLRAEEANAINSGSAAGQALASVKAAFEPLLKSVEQIASVGLDAFIPSSVKAAFSDSQFSDFAYLDNQAESIGRSLVESVVSNMRSLTEDGLNLQDVGSNLTSLISYLQKVGRFTTYLPALFGNEAAATQIGNLNTSLAQQTASGTTALLQALPALAANNNYSTNISVGDVNNNMDLSILLSFIQQAVADALP